MIENKYSGIASRVTCKGKSKRTTKLRSKWELKYLIKRLRNVDTGIAKAFVVKCVNEKETSHILFYPERERLWKEWVSTASIDKVLSFLITGFSDAFEKHTAGGERFAWSQHRQVKSGVDICSFWECL